VRARAQTSQAKPTAYSGDGDRRFRFIATGLTDGEMDTVAQPKQKLRFSFLTEAISEYLVRELDYRVRLRSGR
jgi:hypothetical protein